MFVFARYNLHKWTGSIDYMFIFCYQHISITRLCGVPWRSDMFFLIWFPYITGQRLVKNIGSLFENVVIEPCLLHGDLWSGNICSDKNGQPVILDPACYCKWINFGHRSQSNLSLSYKIFTYDALISIFAIITKYSLTMHS